LDRRSLFEKSDVKTFKKTSPWRTDKPQFISHYAVIGKFTDYNTRRDAADWRQYA
jgi:hypothetical protein